MIPQGSREDTLFNQTQFDLKSKNQSDYGYTKD